MTFVILIGTAILLSAGYAVAAAMPGCVRTPGWPNPPPFRFTEAASLFSPIEMGSPRPPQLQRPRKNKQGEHETLIWRHVR